MRKQFFLSVFILFLFLPTIGNSQEKASKKSPNRAILYSALLPGAGQVYNDKWWKVPIIYAALGTTVYFASDANKKFKGFQSQYRLQIREPDGEYSSSTSSVKSQMNAYRKKRDYRILGTVLVYGMNIIDAAVDAHLSSFDISDELSMRIKPSIQMSQLYSQTLLNPSLSISFHL